MVVDCFKLLINHTLCMRQGFLGERGKREETFGIVTRAGKKLANS